MRGHIVILLVALSTFAGIAHVASAEVRWLSRGNSSATRVDSDRITWIQFKGNEATGAMSDGYPFEANGRDDVRWLKQLTDVEIEWIRVDTEPPAAGTERFWRWSDIRVVRRSPAGLELWSSGHPGDGPANIKVTNANDARRVMRLARFQQ